MRCLEELEKRHSEKFLSGKKGEYPKNLEIYRITKKGLRILLRSVKKGDESLLKDFYNSLSDNSIYQRFFTIRLNILHEFLQKFVILDDFKQIVILAVQIQEKKEECIGVGQYSVNETTNTGDVALMVRDEYQNQGVGTELLSYLISLGKKQGLLGFTADVLADNNPALRLIQKMGFTVEKRIKSGVVEMEILFNKN